MTWILLVMWGLVAVLAAAAVGGLLVPATRTVTRAVDVSASVDDVWALVRTVDTTPSWCVAFPRMEVRATDTPEAPTARGLTLALLDDTGAQTGTWLLRVQARDRAAGTRLLVTESATTGNLVLRFVRSFRSPARRVDAFLVAAAAQLGEDAASPREA